MLNVPEALIQKIKSIGGISDEEIAFFTGKLVEAFIPKGQHILTEGQVCRHLGYVASGLAMYYKLYDGTEIPTDFALENDWLGNLQSFTNKTPSDMYITIHQDFQHKKICICAIVTKLTKVEMNYTLVADGTSTVVNENIAISSPLPGAGLIGKVFRQQHTALFKNITNA